MSDTKIISFNLRCSGDGEKSVKTRAPLMCACLLEYNADSIGMQEATPEWMEYLKSGLSERYDFVGVARDDGKNRGEYGPVFYLKEKYELVDSGTVWLSKTPEKPSKYLTSACYRICTWATLREKETGFVFSHINTHLDHVSESARLKQTDVLLSKISQLEKSGPVVCTGDFNVNEGSPVYKKMCENMADIKYTAPASDRCGTWHDYNEQGIEDKSPIDFIFIKNGFEPLKYKVIRDKAGEIFLSDHFGLYSELQNCK